MEIHFTNELNFLHLSTFAFASLPEHWTTVFILSEHLSYLSGNIISWKIMSFKIKMNGNFLLKSLSVDAFFTLEKLCFGGSSWYAIKVRRHKCQIWWFSSQCSCQTSWGNFWRPLFGGTQVSPTCVSDFETVSCSSSVFAMQESYRILRLY